jgi:hypothetical protein
VFTSPNYALDLIDGATSTAAVSFAGFFDAGAGGMPGISASSITWCEN